VRPLGGVVLIAGCGWCALRWLRGAGAARTAVLVFVYLGSFVLSHLVADALTAWPSVLLAAAITGIAAYVLADSAARGVSPARARP
jgi:hypothetical protein